MATNHLNSTFNIFHILFLLSSFFSQSSANSTICKFTPYPSLCNSILPSSNSSPNVYDYTRSSIHKSLLSAQKFLSLVQKYLQKSQNLTITAIRALEDCKSLAEYNIDFLTSTFQTITQIPQTLYVLKADEIQTLLSAILTNVETCIDSLQSTASAWRVKNGVLMPLSNDTRLYSVSLALFTKIWSSKKKIRPRSIDGKKLRLGNMSLNLKAIYEAVKNRGMLQSDDNGDHKVLVSDIVIVSKNGSGNFTSINDAVAAAHNNSDGSNGYFVIYITGGVYEEYVSVAKRKKYLIMIGDGINKTIITGNRSFVDGWTTFNSATFAVAGTGFIAVNITFRNTAGAIKHQAVAVRNSADLSTFYHCSFEAYQDTLYVHSLRQFYRECNIYGTVDFIFGNAAAVFQNCNIFPRLPMANQFNAITAQGRSDPNQSTGISIQNCSFRAANDLDRSNITIQTYLGRPWKLYSRTVYMQSFMGNLINPAGWNVWSGDFGLNTSYYAEFENLGPGSNPTHRVEWPGFHIVNATDASNFTVSAFLMGDDWIPRTGVPYTGGLL
ncbi:Pectinesterase [Handroanthus impetiginosus]|uniref:Pectinesterase n=1 Tax=Handroanthus impetiginosus TaxID=429701 RepID=A0A2G9GU02_9LAMI|nr:Pectinesterase [Handroanthus impetiginosus]